MLRPTRVQEQKTSKSKQNLIRLSSFLSYIHRQACLTQLSQQRIKFITARLNLSKSIRQSSSPPPTTVCIVWGWEARTDNKIYLSLEFPDPVCLFLPPKPALARRADARPISALTSSGNRRMEFWMELRCCIVGFGWLIFIFRYLRLDAEFNCDKILVNRKNTWTKLHFKDEY